ncbi:MAG TPA: hypothetical protein DCM71_05280 [Runella sp.]|nr:hypothetical protein [Runella sp.]
MNPDFTTFQEFRKRYPIQFADKGAWLGSGTYGKVFKVEDQVETEWVAVKISEYRRNEAKSLRAEVELAQKVPRHANIARYDACYRLETDTGVSDFAIMKYYADGNLADLLKHQKLSDKELRDIVKGILEGLKHLHQQRIVHRDFKPANILISRGFDGRYVPKIADFGLSKLVSQDEIESSDFDLSDGRGTPSYKAPEQIEGGRVSFNLDLWAFGVILYEMLTGEKPFSVGSHSSEPTLRREIERKIITAQLPERLFALPEPYQSIVRRCLVKDIRTRVRKAEELLVMLDEPIKKSPLIKPIQPVTQSVPTDITDVYEKPKETKLEVPTDVYQPNVVVPTTKKQPKTSNWALWGGAGTVVVVLMSLFFLKKEDAKQDSESQTNEQPTQLPERKNAKIPAKVEVIPAKNKPEKRKSEPLNENKTNEVVLAPTNNDEAERRIKQQKLEEENRLKEQAALKRQQIQKEYDELIERGMTTITASNNKGAAIQNFKQANDLANSNDVATAKGMNAYATYVAKGDRIFANEEYEGAKAWYRVAQAIRNTEEIRRKIKECDTNL